MLLACGAARSAAPVEVTLATYHSFPPFYLEEGKGLSYELAQHLTQRARGAYVFRVSVLPRKRLDLMLEAPSAPMAVPWVAPKMFGDERAEKFRWTVALMGDMEVMLTASPLTPDPANPESFNGLVFSGVLGHRYPEIQPYIDRGRLLRQDTASPDSNLYKVALGRADFTMMSASTASYFLNAAKFPRPLRQIDLPWSAFERRMLIPANSDPQLVRFLETSLADLAQDARWQAIFEQYGQKPHTLSLRR